MTIRHQMAASQQIGVNLKVVRSRRMGVDLRAGAAYSHMLESQKNRWHSEVIRIGENNSGMSTSGNLFNRLGMGANMRETLNRRNNNAHNTLPLK